jgi:hypothetical protein
MGVDGPGRVCDGHGLQDEAGASRHLRIEGCRRGLEAILKLLCLDACNAGTDQRFARADGAHNSDDRRAIGGDLGPLDSRPDDRCRRGSQQLVLSRKAQSSRVPYGGTHDRHAMLRSWENHTPVLLTN